MRVKRFRLESYGPFEDSGWLDLSPTMNIFVGENNAGKSAILRSFQDHIPAVPHRSSREWRAGYLGVVQHTVELEYSGEELDYILRKMQGMGGAWTLGLRDLDIVPLVEQFVESQLRLPSSNQILVRASGADFSLGVPFPEGPSTNLFTITIRGGRSEVTHIGVGSPMNGIGGVLTMLWRDKVFLFQALRSSPGRMSYAAPGRLDANAASLAVQLNGMQGDSPELFRRLVSHLSAIFPTVGNLSVSPAGGQLEIRVWATREQTSRELSFSLDDSGTGIAQAIAIIYVAMTFERAVLVIDEISSYLHPAAAKALLRLLQSNYPQHQYVISTHSPEVLSAGRDAKVFWVRKHGFESSVVNFDLNDLKVLREVTGQLGVSMTDVFAAEHIIWVDGETEEACFPMLLEMSGDETRSVLFIALLHTGDFQDKKVKSEKVFQIYERLTSASAPVVSKVAFNFDSDDLTQSKKDELLHQSEGRIHFLPRRNFESFLLHPAAIARVIVEAVKEHQTLILEDVESRVRTTLIDLASNKRYGDPADPPSYQDADWLSKVDGARIIADLFLKVTDQTLEYRKTTHSVALVKDLLEHAPSDLAELTDYVLELVAVAKQ